MIIKIVRIICHIVFRIRNFQKKELKKLSPSISNMEILEIGSGEKGQSFDYLFRKNNTFIKSDIIIRKGYQKIDITDMDLKEKFDIILCLNVLEHVFDINKAIDNLYAGLRKDGPLVLSWPYIYPLHMEPNDYFRLSEYAIRKLGEKFKSINIKNSGIKQFPFCYFCILTK
jgi:SAM-dependent methyltransferase